MTGIRDIWPVPEATVHALRLHLDAASHIARTTQVGLLEEGADPEPSQRRYHVSSVLHRLIRPLLTDDEYQQACAAARSLRQLWNLATTGDTR